MTAATAPPPVARTLRPRAPFHHRALLGFLGVRAVPGVEVVDGDRYARTLRLPGGPGVLRLRLGARAIAVEARVSDASDAAAALAAARRICDAGADPDAIDVALTADRLLAPLVASAPGLRSPGTPDGAELLVRAITGQQVSVAGARTTLARMAAAVGEPLGAALAEPGLTHLFPAPERLAAADPAGLGMPRARGAAIVAAAAACADGLRLEPGVDAGATRAALLALPGVGPWTAAYVAMRALADPDAFPASDLGVRHALEALGAAGDPRSAEARAEAWRPWRAYATHHLWHDLTRRSAPPRRPAPRRRARASRAS